MAPDDRIIVPVADSSTIRQTVEYAVDAALDTGDGYVRFVYLYPAILRDRETEEGVDPEPELLGAEILDRVAVWADEDAGTREGELHVETATLGTDEYLFSPEDVARTLADDVRAHSTGRVILDPEYDPGIGSPLLRPLEYELARYADLRIDEAPVQRRTRRAPLLARTSALQVGALFGLSFVFYQVLAGSLVLLDLVTGAISATIVAVGISRITFTRDPSGETIKRLVRLLVYTPYLLYEILKANVAVAAIILHPRLPIDPRMTRIQPAVRGALPITMLANSITLTPGTLTVRVEGRSLTVHTLMPGAREDLFDGGLERGVRFVFYGRQAMAIGSPRERDETEVLQPPDAGDAPESGDSVDAGDTPESGNRETGGDEP
jgi:multicomponent Na+:H+ antiporter subunit E